jgi:hypothetical protein
VPDQNLDIVVRVQQLTEKAFEQIAGELKKIETQAAATSTNTASMSSEFAKFGQTLKGTIAETFSLKNVLATVGTAVAGAFTLQAVTGFAKEILALGGQISDLSAKTGLSTTAVQELKFAAEQTGASIGTVTAGVTQLSKKLVEGGSGTVEALGSLNLRLEELQAMAPEDAFTAIADAIARVPDPMRQSQLAMELFGRSGAEMLPLIKGGLAELREEAHKLGLVLSAEDVAALDEFGDLWDSTLSSAKVSGAKFVLDTKKDFSSLGETFRSVSVALDNMLAGPPAGAALKKVQRDMQELEAAAERWPKVAGPATENLTAQTKALNAQVASARDNYNRTTQEASRYAREVVKAHEDATKKAEEFKKAQDALFGRDLLAKAHEYVRLLGDTDNLSKLTTEKTEELHKAIDAALTVAVLDGRKIPPIWTEIWLKTMDWNKAAGQTVVEIERLLKVIPQVQVNHEQWYVHGIKPTQKGLEDILKFSGQLVSLEKPSPPTEQRDVTVEWAQALGNVNHAFTNLTGVGVPALDLVLQKFQDILALIDSISRLVSQVAAGFSQWNIPTGGGGGGTGGGGFGGIPINATTLGIAGGAAAGGLAGWYTGRATGNTAAGVAAGAGTGAAVGSIAGPVGMGIGAGVGALFGWLGARKANKEATKEMDEIRERLVETFGGMEKLRRSAALVNVDIERLFALKDVKGVEEFNRMLERFETQFGALDSAAKRYGVSLEELEGKEPLGPIAAATTQLLEDYKTLTSAGLEHTTTIQKMAPAFNEVVVAAAAAGEEIPAALAPFLRQMADLGLLTESAQRAILGMSEDVTVDFAAMQEAAQKYGIDLGSLGDKFHSSRLSDAAHQIFRDFEMLRKSGADVGGVLFGMREEISDLVQQSIAFGTAIPANMRPLVEELARSGNLLDEHGNKIEDLSKVQFAQPMEAQFDRLIDKLDEMIDTLGRGIPGAARQGAQGVEDAFRDTQVTVPVNFDYPNDFPGSGLPGAARGIYARGPRPVLFGEGGEPELGGPVDFMARVLKEAQQLGGAQVGGGVQININAAGAYFQTPADMRRLANTVGEAVMMQLREKKRFSVVTAA